MVDAPALADLLELAAHPAALLGQGGIGRLYEGGGDRGGLLLGDAEGLVVELDRPHLAVATQLHRHAIIAAPTGGDAAHQPRLGLADGAANGLCSRYWIHAQTLGVRRAPAGHFGLTPERKRWCLTSGRRYILGQMDGLLPPNVSLHESALFRDGIDTELRLSVGCSSEGDEIVVWMDVREGRGRRLELALATASPVAAAASFNARLKELGDQGFDTDDELEIDDVQLTRAMPRTPSPKGGADHGRRPPGSRASSIHSRDRR